MAQTPLESWTPGSPLANFREIVFGNYVFPLTFQENARTQKLVVDKRKIARVAGAFTAQPKSTLDGRVVTIVGTAGSGMMGSSGNVLVTATDLENERVQIARLQGLGKQKLFTRWDRYIYAELEEFDHKFLQDGGAFRYADWKLTFYAADPRYYSTTANSSTYGPVVASGTNSWAISHLGNTRAYPVITISGACANPTIAIYQGPSNYIQVAFTSLVMAAGDTLTFSCDPRPETRNTCAVYQPASGAAVNALIYINPSTGLANNIDGSEFLPYIEDSTQQLGVQGLYIGASAGTNNYTVNVTYNDTWI